MIKMRFVTRSGACWPARALDVVGHADNGREALRCVANGKPDVVLMDLRMPVMDGVEAIRRLRGQAPAVKVVALTTFDDDELVFQALEEGAVGYVLKGARGREIADAVRAAAAGNAVLSPSVASKVVHEFARMSRLTPRESSSASLTLSPRERAVLRLVARGASNKEVAIALNVATGTVKNHLTNIFAKLAVTSRTEAALVAREHGIV